MRTSKVDRNLRETKMNNRYEVEYKGHGMLEIWHPWADKNAGTRTRQEALNLAASLKTNEWCVAVRVIEYVPSIILEDHNNDVHQTS